MSKKLTKPTEASEPEEELFTESEPSKLISQRERAESISQEAGELLKQLDEITDEHDARVALITQHGPVFVWQTQALQNIEFALENGGCSGFIVVNRTEEPEEDEDDDEEDYRARIILIPVFTSAANMECSESSLLRESLESLVEAISPLWHSLSSVSKTENFRENFRKKALEKFEETLERRSPEFVDGFIDGLLAA